MIEKNGKYTFTAKSNENINSKLYCKIGPRQDILDMGIPLLTFPLITYFQEQISTEEI